MTRAITGMIIVILLSLLLTACISSRPAQTSQQTETNTPVSEISPVATPPEIGIIADPNLTTSKQTDEEYEIITLLPKDAIRAIDDPQFLSVAEADQEYSAEELIIGVEFGREARAYSIPYLSGHEIVNDTVAGHKIAVTW